ncbi:MAG: hypothetical protein MK080_09820 [Opitutales bacterium]|nr:hypothetical protein [Opitutales bacterium]NRA27362.1 hypothetical protein [Opitutales bacterium]
MRRACSIFFSLALSLNAAEVSFTTLEGEPYIFPVTPGKQAWVAEIRIEGEPGRHTALIVGPSSLRGIRVGQMLSGYENPDYPAIIQRLKEDYAEASRKLVDVYTNLPDTTFFQVMNTFSKTEQAALYSLMSLDGLAKYLELMGPEDAKALTLTLARQRTFTRVIEITQ